jgi:hypothetical protein
VAYSNDILIDNCIKLNSVNLNQRQLIARFWP